MYIRGVKLYSEGFENYIKTGRIKFFKIPSN